MQLESITYQVSGEMKEARLVVEHQSQFERQLVCGGKKC